MTLKNKNLVTNYSSAKFSWLKSGGNISHLYKVHNQLELNKLFSQNDIIDIKNPEDLIIESSSTLEYLIIAPNEFEDHADNLKNLYSNDVIHEDKLITEYVLKSEIKQL